MIKRALAASGFVSLFAVAGCSSDASAPSTATAGAAGGGVGVAGATGAAGATASAGAGGSIISGGAGAGGGVGGAPAGGTGGASAGSGGASGGAGGASGGASAGSAGTGGCAYKYCEDFEGAVAPGAMTSDWKIDVDKTSTVETVATKAHGGTHSQHFKVGTASVKGYITETKSLAAAGDSYWGRVWVWDEIMPTGHIVNIAIDGKSGTMDEQVRIFNVINGNFAINRRSDDKGGVSNVPPMLGKWQCYEWHITPNSLDIYVDNTKLMNVSQTWANPTVSLFRMGFERFTPGNAGEMWMDDLAMNDTQIGCK